MTLVLFRRRALGELSGAEPRIGARVQKSTSVIQQQSELEDCPHRMAFHKPTSRSSYLGRAFAVLPQIDLRISLPPYPKRIRLLKD